MRLYKLITLCIYLAAISPAFAEPPLNNVVLYGNVFLSDGTPANGATYNISVYDDSTGELLSTATGLVGEIVSGIIYESQNTPNSTGDTFNVTVFSANETREWIHVITSEEFEMTVVNMSDMTFQVTQNNQPSDNGGGGGGGGGGGSPKTLIKGEVNVLTSELMGEILNDLNLIFKRFYKVPISLAATFVTTGGETGEYPAPSLEVPGILSMSVKPLTENVYELAAEKVLEYTITNTLIIARGDIAVDSMASVAYARSENVPILLTKPSELPAPTLNAIKALRPNKIIIVGGEDAVSGKVEAELNDIAAVERIGKTTRYETAIELAKMIDKPDTIVITDGENPSIDAVIVAGGYKAPLIYINGDEIPQSVRDYLAEHKTTEIDNKPMNVVLAGIGKGAQEEIEELMKI